MLYLNNKGNMALFKIILGIISTKTVFTGKSTRTCGPHCVDKNTETDANIKPQY